MDCAVTLHVDWKTSLGQTEGSCGSDYSSAKDKPYSINTSNGSSVLEVPVTILRSHKLFLKTSSAKNLARSIWHAMKGTELWIRPNGNNLEEMKYVLDHTYVSDRDYAMFMIHSSELMPGGSPTFKDERSIEKLYKDLEALFAYARVKYEGSTLKEYFVKNSRNMC